MQGRGSIEFGKAAGWIAMAALVVVGLALALPGHARSGKGHHGWGGPGGFIERHAEELGLDDATLAEINEIVADSREQAEAIYAEHRSARDALHQMLDADAPDVDAVMSQAERVGEIDVRKHKHRIATMLAIRAKLTSEQRSQLAELKDEMRERRRERGKSGKHGKHGRHHRGESCGHDDPAGEEAL